MSHLQSQSHSSLEVMSAESLWTMGTGGQSCGLCYWKTEGASSSPHRVGPSVRRLVSRVFPVVGGASLLLRMSGW